MKIASFFAGIGGFDLAFQRAGHEPVWACEWADFPRKVFETRFGFAPQAKDIREVKPDDIPETDLWCGGFPCQDLSVAGKRKGLQAERSGMWWEWHRLIAARKPKWLLIENVPGLLSSDGGRDFARLLLSLDELGYGLAWRVLDAQFFGVPQRRRRVFIVGHLGGECPREILFESESLRGHTASKRKKRREIARRIEGCANNGGALQTPVVTHSLRGEGYGASEDGTGRGTPIISACLKASAGMKLDPTHETYILDGKGWNQGGASYTVDDKIVVVKKEEEFIPKVAHALRSNASRADLPTSSTYVIKGAAIGRQPENGPQRGEIAEGQSFTLNATETHAVVTSPTLTSANDPSRSPQSSEITAQVSAVLEANKGIGAHAAGRPRRLVVEECESLQGFPRTWTLIDGAADSNRYKALGNAVAVPVVEWIARRFPA